MWLVLIARHTVAQELSYETALEALTEGLVTTDEQQNDGLYENLFQLYTQPLNLNEVTHEDLQQLYVLSDRQISNLLRHREAFGNFLTVYELQFVPGLDHVTIFKILPFVTVAEQTLPATWAERWQQADKLLIVRQQTTLEQQRGYLPTDTTQGDGASTYAGSPHKLYTRLRMSRRNDFSVGFTAEKDAGEAVGWQPGQRRYGMDYYSYHVQLENLGKLSHVIVGDYTLQMGQGLLLGNGFTLGKGAEPVNTIARSQSLVRPYTSSVESGFFRGVSATVQHLLPTQQTVALTTFLSSQQNDATVREDSVSTYFESISTTGLHRTTNEIATKNQVREQVAGANLRFLNKKRNAQVGLTYLTTRFDQTQQKDATLQSKHEFSGKRNDNLGVFFNYRVQQYHFFGEAARSRSGGTGAIGGLTAHLSSTVEMALALRHYDADFHTFYGNALSEGTRPINEQGAYWGLKMEPWSRVTISAYYDRFCFPWLRYQTDAPSQGYEYFTQVQYQPYRRTEVWLRFREESKARNIDDDSSVVRYVLPGVKRNLAVQGIHYVHDQLRLRSRVQSSWYTQNGITTRGFAVAQDVSVTRGKWKADVRFALFHTNNFDNRQYVYENDILYAFSIPAYSGEGVRNYLVLRYKLNRHLSFWGRIARTTYYDRNEVGSGWDEIDGTTKTDMKLQMVVKW